MTNNVDVKEGDELLMEIQPKAQPAQVETPRLTWKTQAPRQAVSQKNKSRLAVRWLSPPAAPQAKNKKLLK